MQADEAVSAPLRLWTRIKHYMHWWAAEGLLRKPMMVFRYCVVKLNVADLSGRGKPVCATEREKEWFWCWQIRWIERRELGKSRKRINRVWPLRERSQHADNFKPQTLNMSEMSILWSHKDIDKDVRRIWCWEDCRFGFSMKMSYLGNSIRKAVECKGPELWRGEILIAQSEDCGFIYSLAFSSDILGVGIQQRRPHTHLSGMCPETWRCPGNIHLNIFLWSRHWLLRTLLATLQLLRWGTKVQNWIQAFWNTYAFPSQASFCTH